MRKTISAMFILTALVSVPVQPASAQLAETVALHGYGQFHYGRTNEYPLLGATKEGSYGNSSFSLDIAANPTDRVSVKALTVWVQEGAESHIEFDVAWAQYRISDAASLRMGRSRVPFGNYGEILEVGTLRPFFSLPKAVYGPVSVVAEWYQGAGLTGTRFGASGWGFQWDVFGGYMGIEGHGELMEAIDEPVDSMAPPMEMEEEEHEGEEIVRINDIAGGHVTVFAPVEGLSFGVGAWSGMTAPEAGHDSHRHTSTIASVAYEKDGLHLQGEAVFHRQSGEMEIKGGYVEAAYKLASGVQLGARYENVDYKILEEGVALIPGTEGVTEHKDFTLLLGYWLSSAFVIKAELHLVDGNALAHDHDFVERVEAGGILRRKTTAFTIGSQFSF